MAEVVALHGAAVATYEPCSDVIDLLERYLEEARRGEISGIVLGVVAGNSSISTEWASGRADSHFMVAASSMLNHRLLCTKLQDV